MARILVLYASTHGHTAKIAAHIASVLEDDGATVDLHQLGANETHPAPPDYDAVILGASIHAGHHQHALVKWAERHHTALGLTPSAFFSVCLTAADDTEESRAATRAYLDDFVEQTGWTPGDSTTFAGAPPTRRVERAVARVASPALKAIEQTFLVGESNRPDQYPVAAPERNYVLTTSGVSSRLAANDVRTLFARS